MQSVAQRGGHQDGQDWIDAFQLEGCTSTDKMGVRRMLESSLKLNKHIETLRSGLGEVKQERLTTRLWHSTAQAPGGGADILAAGDGHRLGSD